MVHVKASIDTYAMIISERDDYQSAAKYVDLFEMAWLIRGPGENDINTDYKRWMTFRELENDLSALASYFIVSLYGEETPESELLNLYKSYFGSKLDDTIYPINDNSTGYDRTRDGQ